MEVIFTDEELRHLENHLSHNVEIDEADFPALCRKLYDLDINSLGIVHAQALELGYLNLTDTITAYIERHTK